MKWLLTFLGFMFKLHWDNILVKQFVLNLNDRENITESFCTRAADNEIIFTKYTFCPAHLKSELITYLSTDCSSPSNTSNSQGRVTEDRKNLLILECFSSSGLPLHMK